MLQKEIRLEIAPNIKLQNANDYKIQSNNKINLLNNKFKDQNTSAIKPVSYSTDCTQDSSYNNLEDNELKLTQKCDFNKIQSSASKANFTQSWDHCSINTEQNKQQLDIQALEQQRMEHFYTDSQNKSHQDTDSCCMTEIYTQPLINYNSKQTQDPYNQRQIFPETESHYTQIPLNNTYKQQHSHYLNRVPLAQHCESPFTNNIPQNKPYQTITKTENQKTYIDLTEGQDEWTNETKPNFVNNCSFDEQGGLFSNRIFVPVQIINFGLPIQLIPESETKYCQYNNNPTEYIYQNPESIYQHYQQPCYHQQPPYLVYVNPTRPISRVNVQNGHMLLPTYTNSVPIQMNGNQNQSAPFSGYTLQDSQQKHHK